MLFPHGRLLTLSARTDGSGAAAPVNVRYVKAGSPVHFAVRVDAYVARVHRTESVTYSVSLPAACRSGGG